MAKKVIYEYDRCGKMFYLDSKKLSAVITFQTFKNIDGQETLVDDNEFDLCPDCAKQMAQYMKKDIYEI